MREFVFWTFALMLFALAGQLSDLARRNTHREPHWTALDACVSVAFLVWGGVLLFGKQ